MDQSRVSYITTTPDLKGGRPHIIGRRIAVSDVAHWYVVAGMTPDAICDEYDLTLSQVHAALSYYYDHKAEIDARTTKDAAHVAELRKKIKPLHSN
jgi:uncharacterized protein (DUF433 family)